MTDRKPAIVRDKMPSEGFAELPTLEQANEMVGSAKPTAEGSAKPAEPVSVNVLEQVLDGDTVPEKFRGKKVQDILQSQTHLESRLGSQGQELGQLRALTDRLLDLKRTDDLRRAGVTESEAQLSGDDLLNDPVSAINKVVGDKLRPIEEALERSARAGREADFARKHPSFHNDMQDPKFVEYVQKSAYRQRLAMAAMSNDFDAADELWSGWEEQKSQAVTEQKTTEADRQKALKDATTVRSGGGSGTEGERKPVYSRQALIRKRIDDPTGYYDPAFQEIIRNAYLEGRVK